MLFKFRKPKTVAEKKRQQELNAAFSYVRAAFIAAQLGIPYTYDHRRYDNCQKFIIKCRNEGLLPWWSDDDDQQITEKLLSAVRNLPKKNHVVSWNPKHVYSQQYRSQSCLFPSGFLMYSVAKQSRQSGFWYFRQPNLSCPMVVMMPQLAQAMLDGSSKNSGHRLICIFRRFMAFMGISSPLWPRALAQGH